MKGFFAVILALYGAYYYVSKRFEFHDTLAYAQKHKEAKWAPQVQYYVGVIYYQRAEYGKAQEAFSQMLADHPTDYYAPRALIHLDDAAEYNHDWETAKAALARYIEDHPEGKDIDLAKRRLDMLRYQHP